MRIYCLSRPIEIITDNIGYLIIIIYRFTLLQSSVNFYTKSVDSLKIDNKDGS